MTIIPSAADCKTVFLIGNILGFVGAYLIGSFMMRWITSLRTNR